MIVICNNMIISPVKSLNHPSIHHPSSSHQQKMAANVDIIKHAKHRTNKLMAKKHNKKTMKNNTYVNITYPIKPIMTIQNNHSKFTSINPKLSPPTTIIMSPSNTWKAPESVNAAPRAPLQQRGHGTAAVLTP